MQNFLRIILHRTTNTNTNDTATNNNGGGDVSMDIRMVQQSSLSVLQGLVDHDYSGSSNDVLPQIANLLLDLLVQPLAALLCLGRHGCHGFGHSKTYIMNIIYIQDLAICAAKISIIWSG